LRIADKIAEWLAEKGITHAFGIVGGGNVALWDAITRLEKTRIICAHHEQAAVMAAAYYYRTAGVPAVALVTTGAGSSNAITGAIAAFMDRVPLLILSGNEASGYMKAQTRVWGVQGYDSSGVADMVCKAGVRAFGNPTVGMLDFYYDLAMEPPRGPVWIDIPKDIQNALA
jgi:acetolactate synthase-1/2/3 large subunit